MKILKSNHGDVRAWLNPSVTENFTWILVSHKCLGESNPRPLVRAKSHLDINFELFLFLLLFDCSGFRLNASCFLMTMPFAPWVVNSLCTEKWWKNYLRTHCSVFVCTYVCVPVSSMYNLPFSIFLNLQNCPPPPTPGAALLGEREKPFFFPPSLLF